MNKLYTMPKKKDEEKQKCQTHEMQFMQKEVYLKSD